MTKEKRLEELKKYGVFYDDDYDYMQHLRDVDELYAVDTFAQRAPAEVRKVGLTRFNKLPPRIKLQNKDAYGLSSVHLKL